jgi:RNA polymerase sigma-70 factor (ECF subfamily)
MAGDWQEKDDPFLLEQLQWGSRDAFSILVQRHSVRFYAVAYRFMNHRQQAEDIVQDAFLKLWEHPAMWNPDKNTKFTTWFYRIVVNLCLDAKKRKSALPMAEGFDIADHRMIQDEALSMRQTRQLLEKAIAALPTRQQLALNLCFYEGYSNQSAAEAMGMNLKALQSLLIRAKTTLKKQFNVLYGADND